MLTTSKTHKTVAMIGALALLLAAGLAVARSGKVKAPKVIPKTSVASKGQSPFKGPAMDEAARRERFNEWSANDANSFPTAAAATADLAFTLRVPKLESLGAPAIYVEKSDVKEERIAYIYYGDPVDGISVKALRFQPMDFQALIANEVESKEKGYLKSENVPFSIKVNGYDGLAWEPGNNVLNGFKQPKPGFVQWQEPDGVTYTIGGTWGSNGTTTQELLEIAATMNE